MKLTLTPMDINNKEFKKGMRGYNPDEVDDFLDEVIENYEEIYKENSSLKEKLSTLNEQLDHYRQIESTIQNTLLLAQNAADQAKSSAEKEAEIVLKNANETAQKILDKAHDDVIQINDEYETLKQDFIKFRAKFRNFMNTQLETFDDLEKDFNKNFSVTNPETEVETEDLEVAPEISEESVKTIEEPEIIVDEIDEIKSFFASKEKEE